MGSYTANNYFYKPDLGANGLTEKETFDAALDAADSQIAENKTNIGENTNNINTIQSTMLKKDGSVSLTSNWDVDGAGTLYIDKTNGRVGIGTDTPEAKLDVDGPIFGAGKRRYAKTISVGSDGDILLAYGARINGIWHLRFEGPSRIHHFSFTISADNASGNNVKIHVIKNWCYNGQEIFGKPFIKYRTDGTIPHLYIPISNRNGGTTLDVSFEETAPFTATFMPSSTYNGETLDSTEYEAIGVWETTGSDLYFGSYSKSTNGYTKLPNGLMLQWGRGDTTSDSNGIASFTFPIAFPNACFHVIPVDIDSGCVDYGITDNQISKTGFSCYMRWSNGNLATNTSIGIRYIAIGY